MHRRLRQLNILLLVAVTYFSSLPDSDAGTVPIMLDTTGANWGVKSGFFWAGTSFLSCLGAWFLIPEVSPLSL
jgi:hypothetical protein